MLVGQKREEAGSQVWRQDSSHVGHFKLLPLCSKDTSFFWRLQHQLTTKRNRNIKANDVNLISMARSTDFCFKTTYVCFCAYDRLYVAFNVLFVVRHPLEKQFPMSPPYPSEIIAFEPPPPLPLGISNDLPWGVYGYFLEPHNNCFCKIQLVGQKYRK